MAVPTVTGVTPSSALDSAGGTTVTITGTNFNNGNLTAVKFGPVNAASFVIVNGTTATAVTPAKAGTNTVDVTVTNPSGTSVTSSADLVTYTTAWSPAVVAADESPATTAAAAFTTKFVDIGLDPVFFIPFIADYPVLSWLTLGGPSDYAAGGGVSLV